MLLNFNSRSETMSLLKDVLVYSRIKRKTLFLVGGYLRDLYLNRQKQNPDLDFCLSRQAINFGKGLAKNLRAGFVVLDKEHGAARVVKKIKDKVYTLDFTDFRGKTLEEDLLHRDFTFNALALDLEKVFTSGSIRDLIVDPLGGREDLKKKIIRVVDKCAFIEDPLRILRAFSFSCLFGFKIDDATLKLAKLSKCDLAKVSSERIRDEFFKIFSSSDSYHCFLMLDKLKILELIFPEAKGMRGIGQGPYHHLDVWQHTLETINELENLLRELKNNRKVQDYLDEVISADRKRSSLIKLGAFLHDIGKPKTLRRHEGKITFHGHERVGMRLAEEIFRRLKLSNEEINSLKKIILCHLRPGYLADNQTITPRATFRFFRDAQDEAVSVLLISVADQRATKGPLTTKSSRRHHEETAFGLIKKYFKKKEEKKEPRLLDGHDIMKALKLSPSPVVGKILSELEELQAIGRIKTKAEALRQAKKLVNK
ncbi:MAG: HD domain-containing protein [Candidatus Omnitrophota bacterium]